MILFEGVRKSFSKGVFALENISLNIPKGQFCVLLGTSGAGKSTLLRLVNGLVTPTSGRIEFDGTEINRHTIKRLRPRMAMIHQQFNLVSRLSVIDNVMSGILPKLPIWEAMFRFYPQTYLRKGCHLLDQVGLKERYLYQRAMNLSGGEQQRVAIARAFILDPDVVLADEPVASLDPAISYDILDLLKRSSRQHNSTVLCSLHQIEFAKAFADRIVAIKGGRIEFEGAPDELDDGIIDRIYNRRDVQVDEKTSPIQKEPLVRLHDVEGQF